MKTEIWKNIELSKGKYSVSDKCHVKRNKTEMLLKPRPTKSGYQKVCLVIDGKLKYFAIHRLVAVAFLPNAKNLPQVNHKDENRANNCVENLEWCTCSYNSSYGKRTENLKKKIGYRVRKYTQTGVLVCEYLSINDAAKDVGGEWHGIRDACGKPRTYHGFLWELNENSPALNRYQRQTA